MALYKRDGSQTSKLLLITLQEIQFRPGHTIQAHQFVYFSFSLGERMFFSSLMDANATNLSDDIIIPIESPDIPEILELQRWENHMVLFNHEVDLGELKTRTIAKKKLETKSGEILSLIITVLNEDEIKFGNKLIKSISQHYLMVSSFVLKNHNNTIVRDDPGPSYFKVITSQTDYVVPVINGEICVKLPETLEFQHIRNGKVAGKSKKFKTDDFSTSSIDVSLSGQNGNKDTDLCLEMLWGINLSEAKTENTLLLEAYELYIYDIEIKFDNFNQFANCKVKVIYGNKAFEVASEFPSPKTVKVKKILHFIIKSEDEEINIVVERNLKVVAQTRFYTDEIISNSVNNPKRKFIDNNGKSVGNIKFKCEKAKNLSTVNNNKFWKESNKKKLVNMVLLSIDQISVKYSHQEPISVIIKTDNEERLVANVPNFQYFDKSQEVSCVPIVVNSKLEESVYLMVKHMNGGRREPEDEEEGNNAGNSDFIGIAILNFSELRLGMNSVEIPFFKNQTKTVVVNCLINKVTPFPFIKSVFQPELLHSHAHKTMSLSVFMKKVKFTSFFYTFRYDNKNEVYCIVEANRLKKVLIMEGTAHDDLSFVSSASSDSLNFIIEDTEYIKLKITFLVSDIGQEEEIYGSAVMKMKTQELAAAGQFGLTFKKIEIKNGFGTIVGTINTEVHKGSLPNSNEKMVNGNIKDERDILESEKGPFKSQLKRVKNEILKVNQNMEVMEKSFDVNRIESHKSVNPIRNQIKKGHIEYKRPQVNYNHNIRYGKEKNKRSISTSLNNDTPLHLPNIKSKDNSHEKNSLKELIQMMKIRKRSVKGTYEENSTIQSHNLKHPLTERSRKKEIEDKLKMLTSQNESNISISKEKIQRENPNLERNLEILFPKKMGPVEKKEQLQKQINQYEEKLKGLKSVYQEISHDLEEIEPSMKNQDPVERKDVVDMKGPEWEDNEFAIPNEL